MNTAETSPSGNIHEMPLAISLGIGHPELTEINGLLPKVKPEKHFHHGCALLIKGKSSYSRKGLRVYKLTV
ncbi:hypothetical protein ACJROX_06685 [Pseudalkalibacillus sp. A8]|uniref:hypothetical protein n=1 Tax=Pseudalkalibacillus sp. A8 TaxID=3382641 RepID=UPI0038B4EB18